MQAAYWTPTPRRIKIDWKWFNFGRFAMFLIAKTILQFDKHAPLPKVGIYLTQRKVTEIHQPVQNKQWREILDD